MKCPHCGGEMLPEQVFCEHCGKERLLVPVYEPEIEESVAESMHNIMDDLGGNTPNQNHTKGLSRQTDFCCLESFFYPILGKPQNLPHFLFMRKS